MKILFLDIDGVCNNASTMERFGGFIGINPIFADKVKRIIRETGCDVVLSSTWRLDANSRAEVKKKVCDFIDVTVQLNGHGGRFGVPRGEEVKEWLDRNQPIEKYAILDDDGDFLIGQDLFQASWQKGLTDEVMERVIAHLK